MATDNIYGINSIILSEDERIRRLMQVFEKTPKLIACPFKIVQGTYDVVNGAITDDPNIDEATNYKMFTRGDNFVIAQWENSTFLKATRQGTPEAPLTTKDMITHYQVGKTIDVWIEDDNFSKESDGGYTSTSSKIRATTNKEISESDFYNLYVFPSINNNTYELMNVKNFFAPDRSFLGATLMFEKIINIGNADNLESIITFSSPGEGYAWPKIDSNGNLQLDQNKLNSRGVVSWQVQFDDPAALGSMYLIGRPKTSQTQQDVKLEEPRILLNRDFVQPDGNKLSGGVPASDVYYFAQETYTELKTTLDNFSDTFLNKYSPEGLKSYEGILRNPSNDTTQGSNVDQRAVWNNFTIKINNEVYQTLNGMTDNGGNVDSATGFELNGNYKFGDLLNHNTFINMHKQILPLANGQTYPRATTGIPVIGGLTKIFYIGSDTGWWNIEDDRNKFDKIGLFLQSDYYDTLINATTVMTQSTSDEKLKDIPLNSFGSKKPDALWGLGKGIDVFKCKLSDSFYKNNDTSIIFNTKDLGVDYDNDGIADLLWTPDCKTFVQTDLTNIEFFIDRIIIQTLADTTCWVTFYDIENKEIMTQKFVTNSERTEKIRNWTTVIKTSNWTSDVEFQSDTGEVVRPTPQYIKPMELDRNDRLSFEWHDNKNNDILDDYRWQPYVYNFSNIVIGVTYLFSSVGLKTQGFNYSLNDYIWTEDLKTWNSINKGSLPQTITDNTIFFPNNMYENTIQNPLEWNNGTDWQDFKEINIDLSAYKNTFEIFDGDDPTQYYNNIKIDLLEGNVNYKSDDSEIVTPQYFIDKYFSEIIGNKFNSNEGPWPSGKILTNIKSEYYKGNLGKGRNWTIDETPNELKISITINNALNNYNQIIENNYNSFNESIQKESNSRIYSSNIGLYKLEFYWDSLLFNLNIKVKFQPKIKFNTSDNKDFFTSLDEIYWIVDKITFYNENNPPTV